MSGGGGGGGGGGGVKNICNRCDMTVENAKLLRTTCPAQFGT